MEEDGITKSVRVNANICLFSLLIEKDLAVNLFIRLIQLTGLCGKKGSMMKLLSFPVAFPIWKNHTGKMYFNLWFNTRIKNI
jgi:hypothetical protein